jgi:hypothetical protein
MKDMNDPLELIKLLTLAREPDASVKTRAQLNELLRGDERARKITSQFLADEASIALRLKSDNITELIDDDVRVFAEFGERSAAAREAMDHPRPSRRNSTSAFRWAVGIAAAFALLAGSLFLQLKKPDATIMRVAEVEGLLRWTGDGGRVVDSLEAGAQLGGGTLESLGSDTWARLEMNDGSQITISGQSIVTIADFRQKEIRLRRGIISADVEPQPAGKPMIIYTPTARAEVVGTQFNVVAEPFSTQLTVNEGSVQVTRLVDGSVQDVPADHQVVASMEEQTEFKTQRRLDHVVVWHGSMPEDIDYGKWEAGSIGYPGGLKAAPMFWKTPKHWKKPDGRIVLHVTALKVAAGDRPPVRLNADARLRIRGRIDEAKTVHFGLTTHRPKGGFAGNYVVEETIETKADAGEWFDVELPVKNFKPAPNERKFFDSPVGLELIDCWTVTFDGDAGLQIVDVTLISEESEKRSQQEK